MENQDNEDIKIRKAIGSIKMLSEKIEACDRRMEQLQRLVDAQGAGRVQLCSHNNLMLMIDMSEEEFTGLLAGIIKTCEDERVKHLEEVNVFMK